MQRKAPEVHVHVLPVRPEVAVYEVIGPPGISGTAHETVAWLAAVVTAMLSGTVGVSVLAVTARGADETRVPGEACVGVTTTVELSPPITRVTVTNPLPLITDVPPAFTDVAHVIGYP